MITPINIKKTSLATTTVIVMSVTTALNAKEQEDSGILEEIVVTAQFVEQNLQDTPIAITAMTGDQLEMRGHTQVDSIAVQSPNVTLTEGGGYSGPSLVGFIRGVGQTDFNPALEAGVGLYVDDVYYSQLSGSVLELLDLQRVEVLRGPQGTLAGKNSIGGAIRLYSQRPDEDADGYLEIGAGSRNMTSLRAASNFTIAKDKLYARISGTSRSEDGHVDRLDFNCVHSSNTDMQVLGYESGIMDGSCKTGEDGGSDYTGVRTALRWLASDDVEVNFSVEKVKNEMGAPASVLNGTYALAPTADNATNSPPLVENRVAWNTYRDWFVPNKGEYVTYGNYIDTRQNPNLLDDETARKNLIIPDEMHVTSFSSSLNIDWQLSDSMQLQSITGFRDFETGFGTDLDGSPIPILQQYQVSTHKQLSQEIRLNGEYNDFMEYTVGAFYFGADTTLAARVDLGYSAIELDFIHGPDPVEVTNTAIFANTIMHPTDDIDITLGVRYSTDEKSYTYHRRNPDLSEIQGCDFVPQFDPDTGDALINDSGDPVLAPDFISHSNCALIGLNGLKPGNFEDKRVDYKAAVAWMATDNGMLYYQYSTGFKGGGVNPRPFFPVQAQAFEPEELGTHEVGAKWQLLDDKMRVNTAYFMNTYDGIQLSLLDCSTYLDPGSPFGTPCLAPKNAGDADVNGLELEMDYRPTENWLLEMSLSTLDFEYTSIDPATGMLDQYYGEDTPLIDRAVMDINGDPLLDSDGRFIDEENNRIYKSINAVSEVTPFTPDLTWSLSTQYDIQTGFGMISPRLDASYQAEMQTAATITEYGQIEDRTLYNVSITWLSLDEDWQARFSIRNLTDEYYYTNITDNANAGHSYALMGKPQTMSLTIKHML